MIHGGMQSKRGPDTCNGMRCNKNNAQQFRAEIILCVCDEASKSLNENKYFVFFFWMNTRFHVVCHIFLFSIWIR